MPWEDEEEEEEEEEEEDGTAPAPPAAEAAARVVDEAESGCRLLVVVVVLAAARVAPAGEAKGGGRCDDAVDMVAGFESGKGQKAQTVQAGQIHVRLLSVSVFVYCGCVEWMRDISNEGQENFDSPLLVSCRCDAARPSSLTFEVLP